MLRDLNSWNNKKKEKILLREPTQHKRFLLAKE